MAHIQDVAAYILDRCGPMTAMKLQKLCYYAYGYHLVWEARQLFPEHFEAWANGPVCRDLYRMHRGRLNLQPGDIAGNPSALDSDEQESINIVVDAYGGLTAAQLSTLTHRELPWREARARAGAVDLERSNELLLDDEIAEFFEAKIAADADAGQEG